MLELVDLWKELKNKHNWELHIYGPITNEKYYNKIISLIKINNLSNEIKNLGSIFNNQTKRKIFTDANGFILPSKSENFGISIGESLSFGLPVLTTLQTPWKIINDYKAGYVFNFSRENILKYLDKFMACSEETHYEMSKNAVKLIKEKFESEYILGQYIKLYESLLE